MTSLIRSLKRLRAKHWIVIAVVALIFLHYFGVFIMVREQSFKEFNYPLEGDLSKYVHFFALDFLLLYLKQT